ncbi:MAG: F0F1 ATP synthase subunit A [Rhodospirillaceae bacterium]|nr:F0F1 ATP synthase subunit A [Rhodospirillaceae bacterium]MBT5373168.1 F0F1 ATP synthase subunit A [Rhodospirillaceae bacterium]
MADPLQQFQINPIVPLEIAGINVSLTNSSLAMIAAAALVTAFMAGSMRGRALVPGRWQSMAEISYEFIANMIRDNVGAEGRPFFPFVLTLFMFILFGNLLGLLPYSFTFTSHIIVTFALALTVFIGVTIIGIVRHGLHFFSFFVPKGVPMAMMPLMVPIEIISYLSRPVSLSIRLFANMMAGHTMMKVFGGFVFILGVFGVAPLIVNVALTAFEVLVAFLQAYVFTVLTCLYLNDAVHLH